MNPLSVSYLKIRTEMHQIHSREVNEIRLLIVVNYFKVSIFINEKTYFCMFDVIGPFYISMHIWPNVDTLCTVGDRERFSVFWSRSLSPNVWPPMSYRHNSFVLFFYKRCHKITHTKRSCLSVCPWACMNRWTNRKIITGGSKMGRNIWWKSILKHHYFYNELLTATTMELNL